MKEIERYMFSFYFFIIINNSNNNKNNNNKNNKNNIKLFTLHFCHSWVYLYFSQAYNM